MQVGVMFLRTRARLSCLLFLMRKDTYSCTAVHFASSHLSSKTSSATASTNSAAFFKYWKPTGALSTTLPEVPLNIQSAAGALSSASRAIFTYHSTVRAPLVVVGRLDKDSSGLLLLTNREDICAKLLRTYHPDGTVLRGTVPAGSTATGREKVYGSMYEKVYIVGTSRPVSTKELAALCNGVHITTVGRRKGAKKTTRMTMPCTVSFLHASGNDESSYNSSPSAAAAAAATPVRDVVVAAPLHIQPPPAASTATIMNNAATAPSFSSACTSSASPSPSSSVMFNNAKQEKKKLLSNNDNKNDIDNRLLVFHLREGRNRQIRKMLGAQGNKAVSIHRISFGGISLDGLKAPGDMLPLTQEELQLIHIIPIEEEDELQ